MTAFAVVAEYTRLLVWPTRLSPDYSYNQIPLVTSAIDGRFLIGLALVAACVCGIVVLWRRNPLAAFGLAFLGLTFSIVSNFVITIGTICAERLMYLPSAGALIAAAAGAEALTRTVAGAPAPRVRRAHRLDGHVRGADVDAESSVEERSCALVCGRRGCPAQRQGPVRVRPGSDGPRGGCGAGRAHGGC